MIKIIIPKPAYFEVDENKNHSFQLSLSLTGAVADDVKEYFCEKAALLGISLGENTPIFLNKCSILMTEEYVVKVSDTLEIQASGSNGFCYGLCTLLQLLYFNREGDFAKLKFCTVKDKPKFEFRGFMLDVARHFFKVETVKKLIDVISLLKFNYFHWHLSDDQGFRLESKSFPLLTEIGSSRNATLNRKVKESGFYTQDEIKDVIEYAKQRKVEIIPEIDFPGHFIAALSAYPELSCKREKIEVATDFGIHDTILCGGKSESYVLLEGLFTEIACLFPCKYVHLGGDEAPKNVWMECSDCKKLIEEKGLKSFEELQAYMTNYVINVLKRYGKEAIVWNESLYSGKLDESAICQYWNDGKKPERVHKASKDGRKIIVSKFTPMYLDYPHAMHSLKSLYCFEPISNGIEKQAVIGVESPLWAEYVDNESTLTKMVFPRLLATIELGWCSADKDYNDFYKRVELYCPLLKKLKIEYSPLNIVNPSLGGKIRQMCAFAKKMLNIPTIKSHIRGIKAQKRIIAQRERKD